MIQKLLEFIFPKTCIECDKESSFLCSSCFSKIKICNSFKKISPFQKIYIPCLYHRNPILQKAIRRFKYTFYKDLHVQLSKLLNQMLEKYPLPKGIHIIPVPLHKKREKFRGFNQSELLANKLKYPVSKLLIRSKHTKTQATLNKSQRQKNLKNSFEINPQIELPKSTPLLILDDICTTFSTMREAAKVLQKADFKIIFGIVIAHAQLK